MLSRVFTQTAGRPTAQHPPSRFACYGETGASPSSVPDPANDGFSLLEVLIALTILALVAFTASSSLITLLGAETTANRMAEAERIAESMTSRHFNGLSPSGAVARVEGWAIYGDERVEVDEETGDGWRIWTMAPAARGGQGRTFTLAYWERFGRRP